MIKTWVRFSLILFFLVCFLGTTKKAFAAPYFYLSGPSKIYPNNSWLYTLYVYSDSSTLTAAQAVVEFDTNVVESVSLGNTSSVCSFWAPADPSLGYGNSATPYFQDGNKIVASCGFSNPGYVSGTGQGGQVLTFQITPKSGLSVATNTDISISNTKFLYVANELAAGDSPPISLIAFESTQSAYVEPTPTPTPVVTIDTLADDQLEFVDIATGSSSTRSSSSGLSGALTAPEIRELELLQAQQAAEQPSQATSIDNTIPPPPGNLEQRAPITPLPTPLTPEEKNEALGEVLSIQSLRELLLPGKSEADQKIVWVNLLSALTFLIILTILVWRLITVSRMNKIKSRHMKELLTGELSVLESKLGGENQIDEAEFSQSIEKLKEDIEET